MARKLNWNFVDWQWWVIGVGLIGLLTFLISFSFVMVGEMMAFAMIGGGIILYVRRVILKVMKRKQ